MNWTMDSKFSSFKHISHQVGNLNAFIKDHERYWAHIHEHKSPETLQEHNSLVDNYWRKVTTAFQLEPIIDHLVEESLKIFDGISNPIATGNYLKEIFWATMFFHDFGKININFQAGRMKNSKFKFLKEISFGTEHSKLSSFLFFNYYLKEIISNNNSLSKVEKEVLTGLTIIFVNSILKHHAGYIANDIELDTKTIDSALSFKSSIYFDIDQPYAQKLLTNTEKVFQILRKKISAESKAVFPLFALLKLSYSLITAADYYATSEYMNDLEISDFGILDAPSRSRIVHSFVSNPDKPYNKELIENTQKYIQIPFEELQERNNKNLNLLRQKIASEAIQNLRNNLDKNLFYLEAPTGSGKTNISIAFATELLKNDKQLSGIFYVFPFTTLVDQTFQSIRDTIDVKDDEIIQLHSKAGLPSKINHEGEYGSNYKNYIDYLFVNYPITLLTHIRFFDILKSNSKEANYLLHRLANSVVIIDEMQSYPPKHWDKIIYFLDNYARHFNMKILIMSATLPKIDDLNEATKGKIIELTQNRDQYFLNPNFGNRIDFEYIEWKKPTTEEEKKDFLNNLSDLVHQKSDEYLSKNKGKVRTVIEFISKRAASDFLNTLSNKSEFEEYAKYLISGEILESRRKEFIGKIKSKEDEKVILCTTQVIEAGVDIDMDIGFKDRSLIDSEEQLAGRINREANKKNCKLYIFDYYQTKNIYGTDYRYKIQSTDEWINKNYLTILQNKNYQELYQRVNEKLKKENQDVFDARGQYWEYFKELSLTKINQEFKLINQDTQSMFIPLEVEKTHFNKRDLEAFGLYSNERDMISGEDVFRKYVELVENKDSDFVLKNIHLKKIAGIMAQFIISVFPNQVKKLKEYTYPEEKYGYIYLLNWQDVYTYHSGFDMEKIKEDIFL